MPVMTFTPAFMASGLVCPPGKTKIEYSVADEPGLFVECRASVTAVPAWYLRQKNDKGTNSYTKLGTIKDVTLAQARKQARQLKAAHVLAPKRSISETSTKASLDSMTLDVFMREHYMPHAISHKRSAKKDEQLYRLHLAPTFKDMPLNAISRREVEVFHRAFLQKQSPASADHCIKLMRRALNLAVQWEFIEKNVLKGIKLFMVDNQVENYLDEMQLEQLLHVLRTDRNRTVCLILMFLLSTGARLNEGLTATWKNINIERGMWKVEASLSKSKKPRSIPLNDSALWVLEQLESQGQSQYLFPSPVTGKPYTAITRAWYRLRKKAGVNIRIHDLRHTFASFLVSRGRSLFEVQQILGHSDPKVTMRYAHLSSKALQEAANAGSMIVRKAA
ncbi:site-specific integrase [Acidovorax kalamii]|uniref:Tyr recombinase domain-containing protein n=1 Tax=Acidovorax kalamii TaxID=2004485 RepID=A0A235ENB9_9BURK|nr:site-specific integrase [Acidovorax kalamii]OYD50534.1 hypothetical protein CBY09_10880 [Acidovorax kalamii]